ncbi:rhomboid family intramembrane serine protease [Streptomyces sp. NPDC003077]|uniref:rhomboid family intramembrane serine protease n=1 Tax=Streptomyces sp. NPDC003077 TaxID=3154443 RepID=UPI0033BF2CAC
MSSFSPRAPWVAPLYVGAVHLSAYVTARMPAEQRTELLREHSTNVENLRARRWRTLATSALFVEPPLHRAYSVALLAVLGTAEAAWGARRAAGVFAIGHVGASLLVHAGLSSARKLSAETARAVDVGASYGFNATAGALAASLPHPRARLMATTGLLALGIRPVLRKRRTFTDAGHLAALALGVAIGARKRRTGRVLRPAG